MIVRRGGVCKTGRLLFKPGLCQQENRSKGSAKASHKKDDPLAKKESRLPKLKPEGFLATVAKNCSKRERVKKREREIRLKTYRFWGYQTPQKRGETGIDSEH